MTKLKEGKCTGCQSYWIGHKGEQADQNTLFNAYTRQQLYPEDEGYTDYPFAPTGEQLFNDKKPSDVLKEGNFHFCAQVDMIDKRESQVYPGYACQWIAGFKCCASCFFADTGPQGLYVRGLSTESVFYDSAILLAT